MSWRWIVVSVLIVGAGCRFGVGVPTQQEIDQMQAWASVVTEKDRDEVKRNAAQHTEWAERKKVQWMTSEYKHRYEKMQSKAAGHPTTDATTEPMDQIP